jgi:hypothetical protein
MGGERLTAEDRALLARLAKAGRTVPFSLMRGDPFSLFQRGLIDIRHRTARGSMKITEKGRRALEDTSHDR